MGVKLVFLNKRKILELSYSMIRSTFVKVTVTKFRTLPYRGTNEKNFLLINCTVSDFGENWILLLCQMKNEAQNLDNKFSFFKSVSGPG